MKTLLTKVLIVVFFMVLVFSSNSLVYAQTESGEDEILATLRAQIEELFKKIEDLKERLNEADQERKALREEIRETRGFSQDLFEGLSGDDVRDLQELLSGYPTIYPQGLITGYLDRKSVV